MGISRSRLRRCSIELTRVYKETGFKNGIFSLCNSQKISEISS